MKYCKFFTLEICITKVLQWLSSLYRTQDLNSFTVLILLRYFSAKSPSLMTLESTVFRICILLVAEVFICEVYRFQKTSQNSGIQKNTPGFHDKVATFLKLILKKLLTLLTMRFSARNWCTTESNSGNSHGLDHTCAIENNSVGSTVSAQKLKV